MDDEDAVLLTGELATGYFGAQLGDIVEGDTVAVFGAGPVGLFAAKSAWLMGAGRVVEMSEPPTTSARTWSSTRWAPRPMATFLQHVTAAKLRLQGGSPLNWRSTRYARAGLSR